MKKNHVVIVLIGIWLLLMFLGGGYFFRVLNGSGTPDAKGVPVESGGEGGDHGGTGGSPGGIAGTADVPMGAQAPRGPKVAHGGPLRVGVMASVFHATGPSWTGGPYGWSSVRAFMGVVQTSPFELVPIINRDTQGNEEIANFLARDFKGAAPISGDDAEKLWKLDVIVLPGVWNLYAEELEAIDKVVAEGTPLLQISGNGVVTPGMRETKLHELQAIKDASYGWNPRAIACTVVADHPLLGTLKKGDTLMLEPNGLFGRDLELPLITADNHRDITVPRGPRFADDMTYAPLYVGHHGKGTVVGCNWSPFGPPPVDVDRATGGRFYVRAILWLGQRPLDGAGDK